MKKKIPTDKRTPDNFHFVNARPMSKAEKSEVAHFVRMHVGKWNWQHVKGRAAPSHTLLVDSEAPEDDADSSQRQRWQQKYTRNTSRPVEWFGSDLLDPFQSHPPSSLPPKIINDSMIHNLTVVFPGLIPTSTRRTDHPFVSTWMTLSRQHSAVFHAHVQLSLFYRWVRLVANNQEDLFSAQEKRAVLLCQTELLGMVRKAIDDQSITDAVLMASSALMICQTESENFKAHIESPFQPPLRKLQGIDVYARRPHPIHAAGALMLVAARGIHNIRLPGLSGLSSTSDVIDASTKPSRPLFPFYSLHGHQLTLQEVYDWNPADFWEEATRLVTVGIPEPMVEAFYVMRLYTSSLAQYHWGTLRTPDPYVICDQRTSLQHHILSLSTAQELGIRPSMYESTRLAAVIFGVGIILPMPPSSAPFAILVRNLQAELDVFDWINRVPPSSLGLLVWILTMGGTAATGLPERVWFVTRLSQVVVLYGISSWGKMKQLLVSIVWLDTACDWAGEQLWADIKAQIAAYGSGDQPA